MNTRVPDMGIKKRTGKMCSKMKSSFRPRETSMMGPNDRLNTLSTILNNNGDYN
jgi:hypothetical protein